MKVRFQAIGRWAPSDVITRWVPDTRPRIPAIERAVDQAWTAANQRRGLNLFDGPMCRLENFVAGPKLELHLSPTNYRAFWGTNLNNANIAADHGPTALANPVGLSCALETAEGLLMLGRRTASVAYYPSRIHTFAGALEPSEHVDVFAEIRRELHEELQLHPSDLAETTCLGLIEDTAIRQPELVFHAKSKLTRIEIESNLDATEHKSALSFSPQTLRSALDDPQMTPVALGAILLWGREVIGRDWFDAAEPTVNLPSHEPQ